MAVYIDFSAGNPSLTKTFLSRFGINMPSFVSQVSRAPELAGAPRIDPATLRSISELATKTAFYQVPVAVRKDNEVFGLNVGSTKLIYIVGAIVKIGVSLEKMSTQTSPTGVTYVLPAPEVLSIEIDPARSRVWDFTKDAFGPDAPSLTNEALAKAKEEVRLAACQNKLLEEANNSAKITFEQIAKVTPILTQPAPCAVEPSQPQPNQTTPTPTPNATDDPFSPSRI